MTSPRQDLLRLLAAKSFRLGLVKLASGASSDYYVDCRTTTLVRKSEKEHGTRQRIEGFREKGARVVIVDDVCTTGTSTIQAIEAAREFGFEIVGVMCLVERQEAGGGPNVAQAAPFLSIFTASDVRQEHLLQNDETSPGMLAAGAGCEICRRPATVHSPRIRCEAHKV